MNYEIHRLAKLAGASTRTLRYYHSIGLLPPAGVNEAGYRLYTEKEAELLWQILFYRERGFSLRDIRSIIYDPDFDIMSALYDPSFK